jgi:hypothetical protein
MALRVSGAVDDDIDAEPKERQFDPSRFPASLALKEYIAQQVETLTAFELRTGRRKRRRRPADQQQFERAVAAVLCETIHAQVTKPGSWVYASFSKAVLGRATRSTDFISETFPDIVRCMSKPLVGLLEFRPGVYSPFGGRCTTIRAGRHLRKAMSTHRFEYGDLGCDLKLRGDPLRLRAPKKGKQKRGDLMPVPDGEPWNGFRSEVDRINDWYAKANLTCAPLPNRERCDSSDRYIRRHFNNGRTDHGGRFFGAFWINMKSADRLQCLTIDGEPVVSLDFKQCGVRIAYGYVSAALPDGDLYSVGNLNREGIKKVMNALLHSSKEISRFPMHTRPCFDNGHRFDQVLRYIANAHSPIAHLFGTGFGMKGLFIESQVIVKSLLDLIDVGITALPVHDCVIVPQSAAAISEQVLLKNFREIAGAEGKVEIERLGGRKRQRE